MLSQYQVDIAALSETRFAGKTQFEEVGGGYTFYCIGQPGDDPRISGVGFAIRTKLARQLDSLPCGINDRLMTLRLKLTKDCFATIISTYAPTMANPDETKEAFYEDLNRVVSEVNSRDKLIFLGDFNGQVGVDHSSWPNVLGRHGTGKCNSNGLMLLSLCAQHQLNINTIFQQADKFKNNWMHPRSRQWHMLDYVIVRQRDRCDVHITCCMRGAECRSAHRLLRSKMNIQLALKKKTARDKPLRKLNIAQLIPNKEALQQSLQESLSNAEQEHDSLEDKWRSFHEAVFSAAADTLGFVDRKHQDWFDENEADMKKLIEKLHDPQRSSC
ncbi:craniofacial development protein 2-like [Penaeus vannamei]|uniref:craniofacial development protein 2-like n=1 Tax=Penaeus vannamei TaxID=6689 RepID=UPI00387F9279